MATILGNVPTARGTKLASCLLGIRLAASIGATAIRMSVGINGGSLNPNPSPSDLLEAIDTANVAGIRSIQILLGYAPANCGNIRYLPDEQYWPQIALEWSAFIAAAHRRCEQYGIELAIEPMNEWDSKIGAAFDTVKNDYLWHLKGLPAGSVVYQQFRYLAFLIANVDFEGRKLYLHQVGGGGAAQKATAASWKYRDGTTKLNDAAAAIIKAVKASGGAFVYNTYPNQKDPFVATPKAFCDRFNGYTVPNTGAVHVASVMGAVPWKLGETMPKRGYGIPDTSLVRFRQALFDSIKASGRSFCVFTILGEATDPYALFDMNGEPIIDRVTL